MQQLTLPPEPPGAPFRLLAVHPSGAAVAVASLSGAACLVVRQPAAPPGSGGGPGGHASSGGSSGGGPFSSPVALQLDRNVSSLAFADAALPTAAAAAGGAAAGPRLRLAALHQHPLSGRFAVAEYLLGPAAASGSGQLSGVALQLAAFHALDDSGTGDGSASGSQPGSPSSRAGTGGPQLGQARALVQLTLAAELWHPGARLVLREAGLQLISSGAQQPHEPAVQAAQRWWRQQEPCAAAAAAAGGAAEGGAAAEAAAEGPQPMAISLEQQPSLEQQLSLEQQPSLELLSDVAEESGEDEEMSEAAGPEPPAPAGAAADAGTPAAAAAAAVVSEGGVSGGQLVTCCCWEWQPPGAGQQAAQPPVLVCALEDGILWRLPLPSLADCSAAGDARLLQPGPAASGQRQQPCMPQAARGLAALPGGLLCCCCDCSGLQLLWLAPSGGTYDPLLAPLAAAQPGAAAWEAGTAAAGCCTLPAAATVADCAAADVEGGGQAQLFAACRGTGGDGGSLCVLYPDPKPEPAFELPGAAEVRQRPRGAWPSLCTVGYVAPAMRRVFTAPHWMLCHSPRLQGITGLWGLRQRTADRHHTLALLSFLGGSRLLAAQGE